MTIQELIIKKPVATPQAFFYRVHSSRLVMNGMMNRMVNRVMVNGMMMADRVMYRMMDRMVNLSHRKAGHGNKYYGG